MDINGLHASPSCKAGVLQCSHSCLSTFWCTSSRSVVGEGEEEENIFVTLAAPPAVEQLLAQRTSQRGLLWLPAPYHDQGSIRFSYRLLDRQLHCSLPPRGRTKVVALKKLKQYTYTKAAVTCIVEVPSKHFELAQKLQCTVVPQLNRLHEDLRRYPGLLKHSDASESAAYLQAVGVAVWTSDQGVQLSTLSGSRVLHAVLRVNAEKGGLELCLLNQGVLGIRVAWVEHLAQALQALRQFAMGKTDLQAVLLPRSDDKSSLDDPIPGALRGSVKSSRDPALLQKLLKDMMNKAKSSPDIRDAWVQRGVLKLLAQLALSLDPYRQGGHASLITPLRTLLVLLLKGCPPYSSALHQFLGAAMTGLTAQPQPLDRSHIPLLGLLLELTQELPALAELSAAFGVPEWAEASLLELLRGSHDTHARRMAANARVLNDNMRNDAYSHYPGSMPGDDELYSITSGFRRDFSTVSAGSEANLYLFAAQHAGSDTNHLDTDKAEALPSKRPAIVPRLSLNTLPHQPPAPGSRSSHRHHPGDGLRPGIRLGGDQASKDMSPHPTGAVCEVKRLAANVGENMVAANFAAFLLAKRSAVGTHTASSSSNLAAEDDSASQPPQPPGEWQQPWIYRTKSLLLSLLLTLAPHTPSFPHAEPSRPLEKHLVADLLLPLAVRSQLLLAGQQAGQPALPAPQQTLLLERLQRLEVQLLYAQGQPPALALGQAQLLPLPRDSLLEDVVVVAQQLLLVKRPDEKVYSEVCELLDVVRLGFENSPAPSLLTRCLLLASDILPKVENLLRCSRMALWKSGSLSLMSSLLRLYSCLVQRACAPNVRLVLVDSVAGLLAGHDSAALQQEFAAHLTSPSNLQQLLSPSQLQSLLMEVWQHFTRVMKLAHRQVPSHDPTHHHPGSSTPVLPMSTRSDTLTGCSMEDNSNLPAPSWMTSGTPNVSGASSARRTSHTGTSYNGGANILAANVVNSTRSSPWDSLPILLSPWLPLLEPTSGLVSRQLQTLVSHSGSDSPSASTEVNASVLEFLEAAFSIPNSPFLEDRRITDHHINFHFLQFARHYQSLALRPRRTTMQACIRHLKVLCALARHPSEPIRRRFYQLRILDFFLRELSLEAHLLSPIMPDTRPHASPTTVPYPEEAIRAAQAAPPLHTPQQSVPLTCSPTQSTPSMSIGAWASPSPSSSGNTVASNTPSSYLAQASGLVTIDTSVCTPAPQANKNTPLSQLIDPLSGRSIASMPLSSYLTPASSLHSTAQSSQALMSAPATPQLHHRLFDSLPIVTVLPSNCNLGPPIPSISPTLSSSTTNPFHHQNASRNPQPCPPTPPSLRPLIPALNLLHLESSRPSYTPAPSPVPPLNFPKPSNNPYQTPPPVPHLRLQLPSSPPERPPLRYTPSSPPEAPAGPSRYDPPSPMSPSAAVGLSGTLPPDLAAYMTPDGKFKFGLDLEEDLDRIIELEALTGIAIPLDGLSSVGSARSPRDSLHASTESLSSLASSCTGSPVKRPSVIPPLRISASVFKSGPGPVTEGTSPLGLNDTPCAHPPRMSSTFKIPPLKFGGGLTQAAAPPEQSPNQRALNYVPSPAGTLSASSPLGRPSQSPMSQAGDPLLPTGSEVSAPVSYTTPPHKNTFTPDVPPPVIPPLPLSRLSRSMSDIAAGNTGEKGQGATSRGANGGMSGSSRAASLGPDAKYEWERQQRGVYLDEALHLLVLQIVLELAFVNNKPDRRCFGLASGDSSEDAGLQYRHCPLILHHHLTHPSQSSLLAPLQALASSLGPCQRRLVSLTAPLLQRSMYGRLQQLARGANSQVYSSCAQVGLATVPVALKVVDLDNAPDDLFHRLFGEVSVMEHLASCPVALDLLDCGVYGGRFWMVSPLYRCSLHQWRQQQKGSVSSKLRLYLNIFLMVAAAVQEVAARGVVHFDIKGDNVLLEPLPGVSEEEFWDPKGDEPPFRVVLGDFGEAQVYAHRDQAFTKESRGTEVFKSPEMLLLGFAHQKREHRNFDRRKHSGAGFPHDVWSLGCLLFELLANRLLFVDGAQNLTETASLVSRVCYPDPSQPLLTPEESAAVDELMVVHDLLAFILVRDPTRRPTTKHLVQKLQQVLNGPLSSQRLGPYGAGTNTLTGGHNHHAPPFPLSPGLKRMQSFQYPSPTTPMAPASSSLGFTPPSAPAPATPSQAPPLAHWVLSQHVVLCSVEAASNTEVLEKLRVARVVVVMESSHEDVCGEEWQGLTPLLQACAAMELPCVTTSLQQKAQHLTPLLARLGSCNSFGNRVTPNGASYPGGIYSGSHHNGSHLNYGGNGGIITSNGGNLTSRGHNVLTSPVQQGHSKLGWEYFGEHNNNGDSNKGAHHRRSSSNSRSPLPAKHTGNTPQPLSAALDDALQLVVLIVGQMVRQLGGAHVGNKCLDQLAPVHPPDHVPRLAIVAPAKTLWVLGALAAGYLIHHFHLSPTCALMHLQLIAPRLLSDSEHEHHIHSWLSLLYAECVGPIHSAALCTAGVPRFTCLCGTFQAALRTPHSEVCPQLTPRHCNLALTDAPDCFCNCAGVLEALGRHHGCVMESVQWVQALTQHVWISPMAPTRVWLGQGAAEDSLLVAPGWRLYTCGVCGCVVCASNSQDASCIQLVANWMDHS